jgi:hypothetical protein
MIRTCAILESIKNNFGKRGDILIIRQNGLKNEKKTCIHDQNLCNFRKVSKIICVEIYHQDLI